MKKTIALIILGCICNLWGQTQGIIPAVFKEKEILNFKTDTTNILSLENIIEEKNLITNFNNTLNNLQTYSIILNEDSVKLKINRFEFKRSIDAYEFFCQFFSMGDEKSIDVGWLSIQPNDSLLVTWYEKTIYAIQYFKKKNHRFDKLIKKVMISSDKFKNIPNFLKIFPTDDLIRNSCKISTKPFLQQDYLSQTYFADYESKSNISRIFIVPIMADSIFIHFQKFREFWKTRGLLIEQDTPIELPHFIAQDVFLGRMLCVIYQNYIIGIMNYPSLDWTKDYLEKVRENLKKHPVNIE